MAVKLTAKQEMFCREYAVVLCATQAAIRAGYTERSAYNQAGRLMSKDEIKGCIAELQAARNAKTCITATQTIADLRELADIALGRKPYPKTVIIDGEPHTTMVKNISFSGAARALELLGRHLGVFNDRLHIQHSGIEGLLEALAEVASSTPAERIKARLKGEPVH